MFLVPPCEGASEASSGPEQFHLKTVRCEIPGVLPGEATNMLLRGHEHPAGAPALRVRSGETSVAAALPPTATERPPVRAELHAAALSDGVEDCTRCHPRTSPFLHASGKPQPIQVCARSASNRGKRDKPRVSVQECTPRSALPAGAMRLLFRGGCHGSDASGCTAALGIAGC